MLVAGLALGLVAPSISMLLPDVLPPGVRVSDARGRAMPRETIEYRPLVALGADRYRTPEGRIVRVAPRSALVPLVEDAATATIRRRWVGRRFWPYGGHRFSAAVGGAHAEAILDSPATAAVRVSGLYRLRQPGTSVSLADESAMREGESVRSEAPILLIVRPPAGVGASGWSGSDPAAVGRLTRRPVATLVWSDLFADEAHLYRTFSAKAPAGRARAAARSGAPVRGMSPDEAAWALGWPPKRGTLAELRRLKVWNYPAPAPFGSSVTFRAGRVATYSPPGRLP